VSLSAGFEKHVSWNIRSAIAVSIVSISIVIMTDVKRSHTFSGSEPEANDSVVEKSDNGITDWSKENDNAVKKVTREMKSETLTHKSPDVIKALTVSRILPSDGNNMIKATHEDGTCMDERFEQREIKSRNITNTRRIIIDVLMISLAFMVHFTAFLGTSHLQSSVNAAEGLGTRALMTIYVGLSVSAIFLPVLLIKYVNLYCRMRVCTVYLVRDCFNLWQYFT
jgi:hypothetical protein